MNKPLYRILCLLTMLFFILIFVQEQWHPFPVKPLNGVTEATPRPQASMEGFRSGELQDGMEQYSREHFGFREYFIRAYNQYLWDFHKQTDVQSILIGKKHYLYNTDFIEDYQGVLWKRYAPDFQTLENNLLREARRLRKLQDLLAERGKLLFVLMEPSKVRVYPEYLPDDIVSPEGNLTAADLYPAIFDSLGVNYLNVDRWFQSVKDSVPYPLYPQFGTHWSNLAALHATDSILGYMEKKSHSALPRLAISDILYDTTMVPDDDLEKLLNLAWANHEKPNLYAPYEIVSDSNTAHPSWLVIGDSYFWNIAYHIKLDQIFSRHHFWYYNSSVFYDPAHTNTREVDLYDELMQADIVTVAYCTANLYAMSNMFSAKALVSLCHSQEEIDQVLNGIKESMRNTPEWLEALQGKADAKGQSLDAVMQDDAEYMLYMNVEDYFPLSSFNTPSTSTTKLSR